MDSSFTPFLELVLDKGVLMIFFLFVLLMIYKAGAYIAPLLNSYMDRQALNQENIAATLRELTQLQTISNVRLEAIEKQLRLFEGLEK
jgi:hypothetical protein